MFECKLICTDIDGTLLDGNHQITDETKHAIAKAYKQGITIALVSGRIAQSIAVLQEELDITGPLGCYSGSLVLDRGKTLASHPVHWQSCLNVLSAIEGSGLETFVFTNESWYIDHWGPWYDVESEVSKTQGRIVPFSEMEERFSSSLELPYKLLCMSEDTLLIKNMERKLKEQFSSVLNIYTSSPKYIEISQKGIDKGHAVRALCTAYGYAPSQVMAIGDYYNDIGMFRAAGYAVAMDNAPDEVKQYACHITSSNKDNGLAKAIEAIL
ncbi:MAG: Cof-type HAD-IIB family hydrolase [Sphaerochaeta sp.]